MSASPRLQRKRRRRNVAVKTTTKTSDNIDRTFKIDTNSQKIYGEHIAAVTRALVSKRFNPNYNPKTPFDKNWDNIKMPVDTTVKIANLWKAQYLTNKNQYTTRTKPAASYYVLLSIKKNIYSILSILRIQSEVH